MPKSLNSVPHTGGSITAMRSDLTLIKAGTGILTKSDDGTLDRAAMVHLVAAIAAGNGISTRFQPTGPFFVR